MDKLIYFLSGVTAFTTLAIWLGKLIINKSFDLGLEKYKSQFENTKENKVCVGKRIIKYTFAKVTQTIFVPSVPSSYANAAKKHGIVKSPNEIVAKINVLVLKFFIVVDVNALITGKLPITPITTYFIAHTCRIL